MTDREMLDKYIYLDKSCLQTQRRHKLEVWFIGTKMHLV